VNLEVIDPSTWNYVALKEIDLGSGGFDSVYTTWRTGAWTAPRRDVFVRLSVVLHSGFSATVLADDLVVNCTT
jgi:hypothetical protein